MGSGGNSVITSIFLASSIANGDGGGGGVMVGAIITVRWGHESKSYSS